MLTDRSRRALTFCSSLAIATALVSTAPAHAQSFQGTGTFNSGSGNITTGTGTTTVSITSSDAVIDWTTFDTAISPGTPINFQPSGTTATFSSGADFSVLNRILPTDPSRPIQFNGTVVSQIVGAAASPGGTVYFYSPGGLIIGSSAVFNVGNLGLTSVAPAVVGGVFEQNGPTAGAQFVAFNGAVSAGTGVFIQPGAQINSSFPTNGIGSYVAIVAPVIDQRGTINVDGGAALISADAATITFNPNGLFDIQVTSGTSGTGTTWFNNGSIGGPAFQGTGANHRIYAVAVPKNDAITMLIADGSALGFNVAGAADVTGNAIVLSGGKDIFNGTGPQAGQIFQNRSVGTGSGSTDIRISNSTVTSSLTANTTGLATLFSSGGGTMSAASAVTLRGDIEAEIASLGAGSNTTINGNAGVFAQVAGGTATGGTAEIFANTGGLVTINGTANVTSFGTGTAGTAGAAGQNATGGVAIIQALTGGMVNISGNTGLAAIGQGGQSAGGIGGNGQGGLAQIFARDNGSSISIGGTAVVQADGFGGFSVGGPNGGTATGGTAIINAQVASGASITINGATSVFARGQVGSGSNSNGGNGVGGTASVAVSDGNTVNLQNTLTVSAIGQGANGVGAGFTGGNGTGGTARLNVFNNGTLNIAGATVVDASGNSGTSGAGALAGGTALGGTATAIAQQNSVIDINSTLNVVANGFSSNTPGRDATGGTTVVGASGNSRVDVAGVMRVLSYGVAGINNGAGGGGGDGLGGSAQVFANTGGDVLANELNVAADGIGGANIGNGAGTGTGGFADIFADGAGSTITVALGNSTGVFGNGDLDFISAEGIGGQAPTSGVGGAAFGGTANITAQNSAVLNGPTTPGSQGFLRIIARGTGGGAGTGATAGGDATAGTINIVVDNATMTSAPILPSAFAQGGNAFATATGSINGGNAVGGNRFITVRNGGTLSTSTAGGSTGAVGGSATATGRGGDASGGNGRITVDGGTFNVADQAIVFVQNTGGDGGVGGNASGGQAFFDVVNGGVVNVSTSGVNQRVGVSADNRGGNSFTTPGTAGGNGSGGLAQFILNNGTVNAANVEVSAVGIGGGILVSQGGIGTGGTARLQMRGGTITGTNLSVDASGRGGAVDAVFDAMGNIVTPAPSGNGGNGNGGFATLEAVLGTTTLNFTDVEVRADGLGGAAFGPSGNGGNGGGGGALLFATGGATLTVNAPTVVVNVDSEGGFAAGAGDGGSAIAGQARVVANSGVMTINGDLEVDGNASGGDGVNGGNARPANLAVNAPPNASIAVNSGSLTVTGFTQLDAEISGGDARGGGDGGNATGAFAQIFAGDSGGTGARGSINLQGVLIEASATGGSAIGAGDGGFAAAGRAGVFGGGGDIMIAGNAELEASSTGGDGLNGGDAISPQPFRQPRALIGANNGTVTVGGFALLTAAAFGGNATEPGGGRGGVAFAGQAGLDAQSPNGPSAVTVGDLLIDVSGIGGFGGAGLGGQAGGAGGDGYGGFGFANGAAGRGVISVNGTTVISADGFGGFGGSGGSGGTTAAGGAGGAGGRGLGGGFSLGTVSGADTPSNTGSATFGNVSGTANGFGGDGGDGGTGTTQGAGGNGGTGAGGFAGILVRGSPATFGDVTFDASGFGGDGGAGSVAGNGGNGAAGDTNVLVTQRFMRTERGSLTANDLVFTANGVGGIGATNGQSFYSASNNYDVDGGLEGEFLVRQSDVTINSYSATYGGDTAPDRSGSILQVVDNGGIPVDTPITIVSDPFDINLAQATVNVAGAFSVTTPGNMRVVLDSSSLNVADLTLSAGNFLAPATLPAVLGTITVANSLSISSLRDVRIYANLLGAISGVFDADGDVLTGDLTVDGPLDITALGSISLGNVNAGDVTLAAGTTIATAAISSGGTIDLTAPGNITTGTLTASDSVFANAGGLLTTGAVSAGLVAPLANAPDGYTIGLRGQTGLTAGNLSAAGRIGLSSPGSISIGSISAGPLVLALAGTGFTSGAITTASNGRVYLASNSMESLGGTIGDTFDPAPILAVSPVAMAGPITINGGVSTSALQARTDAALAISGAITAAQVSSLVAGTTLSTGNVTAGNGALFAAGAGVTVGNVDVGIAIAGNPTVKKIAIGSTSGPVTTGSLSSAQDLGVQTGGSIATGALRARDVLLLAGGSVATGSIDALNGTQPTGRVYVGNFTQATPTANVFQAFNASPTAALFNAEPTRIGGSLTFNAAINAGSLLASAAQGISLQAVTTPGLSAQTGFGGFIDLDSGGAVTVNGRLAAGDRIDIASADIVIGTNGSLDALSASGEIQLASNNTSGIFVGDGASGTTPSGDRAGYVLDNAEFGKLKAGEIAIIGDDLANATDMTIGNLSISGSQLYGSDGTVVFATGNRATETPSGILRIAGAVNATGFAPTQSIELYSGTVELEAANGSLKVADSSGGLGGTVLIEADRIHVASDAILTKLRADPFYAGRIAELNAPASTQRPDGVLNALGLEIFPGQTLYVQNTGSALVPAGFVTTFDNSEISAPDQPPTNGVAIVINGQFQTSTGRVTGAQAVNLILADPTPDSEQFFGFAADAQLNGCVFTGGCTASTEAVNSVITSAIAAVASPSPSSGGAATVTNATVDDSPSAPAAADADEGDDGSSEEQKDEDSDTDEGASPIAPPQPLISTRSLDGTVTVVEPVSGAGNPALIGSAVDEAAAQGEPQ